MPTPTASSKGPQSPRWTTPDGARPRSGSRDDAVPENPQQNQANATPPFRSSPGASMLPRAQDHPVVLNHRPTSGRLPRISTRYRVQKQPPDDIHAHGQIHPSKRGCRVFPTPCLASWRNHPVSHVPDMPRQAPTRTKQNSTVPHESCRPPSRFHRFRSLHPQGQLYEGWAAGSRFITSGS